MNTATFKHAACGTQTAFMKFGGTDGRITNNEIWDGSSWTEVGDLPTGTSEMDGAGTTTAALCMGGTTGSVIASVEEWNGTAWTEGTDLNSGRANASSGQGSMTSTAALFALGSSPGSPNTGKTELWDGTSWVEQADASAGRASLAGAGTTAAFMAFGGSPPTSNATEEFTQLQNIKVITD